MAWVRLVLFVPILEPMFLMVGKALNKVAFVSTLYREARNRYQTELKQRGQQFKLINVGSISIKLDITEFRMSDAFFLGQTYEPATTAAFLTHIKPGDVVVDIGVNAGYFSIIAGHLVGEQGRVVGFEPNPPVREMALRHLAMNGLQQRVRVVPEALSDASNAAVEFWVPTGSLQSGLATLEKPVTELRTCAGPGSRAEGFKRILVPTNRFDTWAEENQIKQIDFMKVDVEGAEHKVFLGMTKTLEHYPPKVIICETTPESPADQLLRNYGYVRKNLENLGGTWINLIYYRTQN